MGNLLCCWRSSKDPEPEKKPGEHDPVPELYNQGAEAWMRYISGKDPSDLRDAIAKCNRALPSTSTEHPHRNLILLVLIFAMLEQSNDRSSLKKIEEYFDELERSGSELKDEDARAIAGKLAAANNNLYRQAPSNSDFEHCLNTYKKLKKYSDTPGDKTTVDLDIVALYREAGQTDAAMKSLQAAKRVCPEDRPDLLAWISMTKFTLHQELFRNNGSSTELQKAITEGEAALRMKMETTERARVLVGVAQCIYVLSENRSDIELEGKLRDAITYGREAVGLDTGDERSRAQACIALADVLSSRRTRPTIQELDEAIMLYRQGKEILVGDPMLLGSLANAICFRCEKGEEVVGNMTTFQSAVQLYEEALQVSSDSGWNARIANNVAYIYVDKANNTKKEADYEKAREYYLKAANYLEAAEGYAIDIDYYKDQANRITKIITSLREGGGGANTQSPDRRLTPKRKSTARGSI